MTKVEIFIFQLSLWSSLTQIAYLWSASVYAWMFLAFVFLSFSRRNIRNTAKAPDCTGQRSFKWFGVFTTNQKQRRSTVFLLFLHNSNNMFSKRYKAEWGLKANVSTPIQHSRYNRIHQNNITIIIETLRGSLAYLYTECLWVITGQRVL